jgi:C4-dicarboxylate-specific signal transduction histidine kinase
LRAGAIAGLFTVLVVLIGASLFIKITNPMIKQLETRTVELETMTDEMGREIEERKRIEDALQKAHDNLERRVQNRTAQLVSANELLNLEIEERKNNEKKLLEQQDKLRSLSSELLLTEERERRRIDIEDDGLGFDISELDATGSGSRGFGLFSIRERISPLGGRMQIQSEPGGGTRATIVLPLACNLEDKWE